MELIAEDSAKTNVHVRDLNQTEDIWAYIKTRQNWWGMWREDILLMTTTVKGKLENKCARSKQLN